MSSEKLSSEQVFLMGSSLDGDTVLHMLAEGVDDMKSPLNSMIGLVAERILALKIPNGREIVWPVACLIQRNMRHRPMSEGYDETLASLRGRLSVSIRPRERMVAGLELGDRAAHCAAGWMLNGRHILKVMHLDEADSYSLMMARMGYLSALEAAKVDRDNSMSRLVRESAPESDEQLGAMVQVLNSIIPEQARVRSILDRWIQSASIVEEA